MKKPNPLRAKSRKPARSSTTAHEYSGKPAQHLQGFIRKFSKVKILVVGDLILDRYIFGKVNRISPEAPVPVVHVESEALRLGGAANVYNNILALGGDAEVCGVVGRDPDGMALMSQLRAAHATPKGVVVDPGRPTTRKTRILAHSQQVVRYDIEHRQEVSFHTTRKILQYIRPRLPQYSCIVISDYAKGVVTASLMSEIGNLARMEHVPIVVDPKVEHFSLYAGVTVITPNHLEAHQGLQGTVSNQASIHQIGHQLRHKLGCEAVLVTRGEQGMSLCEPDGSSSDIPALARQVYDVTGAGDTVISTLALALSVGASLHEGALLANHAAGVVVGMVGTASVTQTQLSNAVRNASL